MLRGRARKPGLLAIGRRADSGRTLGEDQRFAESTLAEKAAGGFPKTKLVRTGALKESLTTVEGGSHGIREVTGSELLFGHYCLVRHFCADWH
jgi:hypothetical protein